MPTKTPIALALVFALIGPSLSQSPKLLNPRGTTTGFAEQALESRLVGGRFLNEDRASLNILLYRSILESASPVLRRRPIVTKAFILSLAVWMIHQGHGGGVSLAGVIWNSLAEHALNAKDRALLDLLPAQSWQEERAIISAYPDRLLRAAHERANPLRGRTLYLVLAHPFELYRKWITHLRLKGYRYFPATPRLPYLLPNFDTAVDPRGWIVGKPAPREERGGLLFASAELEFSAMHAAPELTDVPILLGRYPEGPSGDPEIGYFAAGMEGEDRRLVSLSEAAKPGGEEIFGWTSASHSSGIFLLRESLHLAGKLGESVRDFHEWVGTHNSLRLANIGATGFPGHTRTVLRDLENMVLREAWEGPKKKTRVATARLLDLERPIRDFVQSGQAFIQPEAGVIAAFLRGYFGEQLPERFSKIVQSVKDPRFASTFIRLEKRLAPRLVEFNPRHPHAQSARLWNALFELPLERRPRPDSHPAPLLGAAA